MNRQQIQVFGLGGAITFAVVTAALHALIQRRFSWAGIVGGSSWFGATWMVRKTLVEPRLGHG
jgi:hypothetical protein